jgi:predicted Zn-dependent peptidase
MQINNVVNLQNIQRQQNFKGSSANSSPFSDFPSYQPIPLEISKAYASPQITEGYREIETFDVPYVGKGKLYELSNGHKVAIIPKKGSFVINSFVKAGHEQEPITGHFLEHLIYNSENIVEGKAFADNLADIVAYRYATTHNDYTNYRLDYAFNDKESIEKLIKIQSNLLQYPQNITTRMEKEKGVLISEYTIHPISKSKIEEEKINYLTLNNIFNLNEQPKEHFNEIEKVKSISLGQIINYYNNYYNNNNMITFIEGDVQPSDVIKIFSKYFNKPNQNPSIKKPLKQDLSQPLQSTKRIDINLDSSIDGNIQVNFVGPKNNDKKEKFLAWMLQSYVRENQLGYKLSNINTDEFGVNTSIMKFSDNSEIGNEEQKLQGLYEKIFNLAQKEISDEDFSILKLKLKDYYSSAAESAPVLSEICGKDFVKKGNMNFDDEYKYIDLVTKEDLQNFAKTYIDFNKALVVVAHNKANSKQNQPSFSGKSIETNNIKEYKYQNNLQLLVDNSEGITRTTYKLNLIPNNTPDLKPGVAELLAFMLNDSIKQRIFKSLPNNYKTQLRLNNIELSLSVTPEQTEEAIKFVNSVLQVSNFTQENFDKNIKLLKQLNSEIIDNYTSNLYAEKYAGYPVRYSLERIPSKEERMKKIEDIKLSDVVEAYNQIMRNAQGKAVLVMPKDEFEKQKDSILSTIGTGFSSLQPKKNIQSIENFKIKPIEKTKILINEINNSNASISQDFQIINSGDLKEQITIELLNSILGDSTNSRIEADIREQQGLSYNAGSIYETDGTLGYFSLGASFPSRKSNPKNLQSVLESLKRNINGLTNIPVNDVELERAKKLFKSDVVGLAEFSSGRSDILSEYSLNDTQRLFDIVDKITSQDIQNIAKTYLTKPSIISINANKDVIDANKEYLSSLGEIVQ